MEPNDSYLNHFCTGQSWKNPQVTTRFFPGKCAEAEWGHALPAAERGWGAGWTRELGLAE